MANDNLIRTSLASLRRFIQNTGSAVANRVDRDKYQPGIQLTSPQTRSAIESKAYSFKSAVPQVFQQLKTRGATGSITDIGQAAIPIAKRLDYSSPNLGQASRDRQNKLFRQAVPRYLEAATQAPGSFLQGLTHNLVKPIDQTQYGTTKATNLAAQLGGFAAGPGKFYYSPIEAPVEAAVSKYVAPKLGGLLAKGAAAVTAEGVSSLPVSALESKISDKPFLKSYGENVAYGLGARGVLSIVGAGAKQIAKLAKSGEPGFINLRPGAKPAVAMSDGDVSDALNLRKYVADKPSVEDFGAIGPEIEAIFKRIKPQLPEGTVAKTLTQKLDVITKHALENQLYRSGAISNQAGFIEPGAKLGREREEVDTLLSEGRKQIGEVQPTADKSIKEVLNDNYTKWVDRYNPISRASKQAKKQLKAKGASLRPEFDPDYAVRRLTGAGGIANYRFKAELDPILKELEASNIDKLDMDVYLANKRMAGFGDAGREIYGADPIKSRKIVQALEEKYPGILDIAEKFYQYEDKGFGELINSGFISPENAKIIKEQNPDYAPLYRVMDEMDEYLGVPTKKTMQGTSPIAKLKGSKRKILSPVESIIGNTFRQRAAIEKNNVARNIVGLQDVADMGFKKVSKSSNDTITIWKDGKKEYWNVGKDIADVAKGANEESMNLVLKILQQPAALLRQGATGRNPEFMVPNVIRDQLDAGITSKYGYIPFVDYVSGLKSMLTNDDIYKRWEQSGAKIDLGELSGRKSVSQLFDEKKAKKSLFNWLGQSLDVLGKYSEEPTRVGLFKKAYKKTGNELLAAMESRDATVDFARMGSNMKVANSIIPFLNVGVQGFDKLIRAAKDNPAKVSMLMGLYGATPATMTTLYNLQKFPEEYAEIPEYDKESNFVIVKGRNEDGTVDYLTFPKGNVLPIVSNPVQSFLEFLYGNDSKSFTELATNVVSSTLPVLQGGDTLKEVGLKTAGSLIPQAGKPLIENMLNKSFYKYDPKKEQSKDIVPYFLQDKPPYQQDYEFTPQMYKKIGAVVNASPLKIKNLMEGYLAGYSKIPAQVVEMLYKTSRGEKISPNEKTLMRRFVKQTYPGSAKKPQLKPESPGLMERVTGKAAAAENIPVEATPQNINQIKDKVKYGNDVTEDELKTAYLHTATSLPKESKYQKSIRDSKLYAKLSTVEDNENLTPQQKITLKGAIANELGIKRTELEYYKVAKDDNDSKTMFVLDKVPTFKDNNEFMQYLVDGRKKVNGKLLVSDGVIDNLVDEGLLPYELGKELKKLDYGFDGKLKPAKAKKGRKGKKGKKPKTLKLSVTLPKSRIKAPTAAKLKVKPTLATLSAQPEITGKDLAKRVLRAAA